MLQNNHIDNSCQPNLITFMPFVEPVILIGEGQYNINVMTKIEATDSYLGLDQHIRGCQNVEPYYNCTTRHYLDALIEQCGCMPASIRLKDKVLK